MNVKKFNEFEVINESKINEDMRPMCFIFKDQLNKLCFDVFENAKTKEDIWNIIEENLKKFEEEKKIPLNIPDGAYM